jgi:hypothetical protein
MSQSEPQITFVVMFLLPLAVLGLLIFVLSLLLTAIDGREHTSTRHPEEQGRTKREKATLVVLTITAIFAVGGFGASLYADWVFNRQLGEMRSEKRAWVEITIIKPNNLIVSKSNVSVNVTIYLRNLGHTPAIDVVTSPKFVPAEGLQELERLRSEQCVSSYQSATRHSESNVFYKRTIFPNDIPVSAGGYGAGIAISSIVDARNREFHTQVDARRGRIAILGCVDYDSMDIHHQTGFIVNCGMKSRSSENPDAIGPFDLANEGAISNDQWHCVFEPGGTFAN